MSGSRRRSVLALALLCVTIAFIGGCGGGDATSPPPAPPPPAPPPPPPPPPPDVWSAIAGRSWTMPGETEGYVCVGVHVTSDAYYTGFRLPSPSSVQNEVLLTVSSSPVTEGSFACGPGSLATHLIYAASTGTNAIEFPAGFGVHVAAGQYLLLNIHLNNPDAASASDSTGIEARIGTASDVTTPIDMMLAGTFLINIPSDGVEHTASGACNVTADNHLLAFLPLMRSAAVRQAVTLVTSGGPEDLYNAAFDRSHDSYTMPATPIQITAGQRIDTVCSYVNNSGATLNYGEASYNESCFNAIYRYPTSATSSLFDCAEGIASFDIMRE